MAPRILKKDLENRIAKQEATIRLQSDLLDSRQNEIDAQNEELNHAAEIMEAASGVVSDMKSDLALYEQVTPWAEFDIRQTPADKLLFLDEQTLDIRLSVDTEKGIFAGIGGPLDVASAEDLAFDLLGNVVVARGLNLDEAVHYLISQVSSKVVDLTFNAVEAAETVDFPPEFAEFLQEVLDTLEEAETEEDDEDQIIDLREPATNVTNNFFSCGDELGIHIPEHVDHRDTIIPAVKLVPVP